MKRVLSVLATIAGIFYLAAGFGILVLQDAVKAAMGYSFGYGRNVYPIQNVLELVLFGIPCVALGILSMPEESESRRGTNLLLVIYSGGMLAFGGLLTSVVTVLNNIIVARTMGADGVASMAGVNVAFSYIHFLVNLSLVLLLLRGALSLGAAERGEKSNRL